MNSEVWFAIGLSVFCGLLSAILNIPWGIFWGWIFARKQFVGKTFLQTILYCPLVLPPVLTGYFLLLIFGRNAWLGYWLEKTFGVTFVLDWKGALIASWIISSPFMIETMRQSFSQMDSRLETVARGLGADFWRTFFTISLPLAKNGILSGFFLCFARSIGEFGATIIVAGNIPGRTQTIPLSIFNKITNGEEASLWPLIMAAMVLSYVGLSLSHYFLSQKEKVKRD